MRVLVDGEAESLEARIIAKAQRAIAVSAGGEAAYAPDQILDLDTFRDWLRFRFRDPLKRSASAGPAFGKASTAISVTTIGAGLASSALANASVNHSALWLGILGIGVGVLAAINQIWRPGQRSVARYQAAFALRREGWDFVQNRGRYERLKSELRLGAFIDEVNRVHRAVESVDEATSPTQPAG